MQYLFCVYSYKYALPLVTETQEHLTDCALKSTLRRPLQKRCLPTSVESKRQKEREPKRERAKERGREPHICTLSCHARRLYKNRVEKKLVKKSAANRQQPPPASDDDDPFNPRPPAKPNSKKAGKVSAVARENASSEGSRSPAKALQKSPPATPSKALPASGDPPPEGTHSEPEVVEDVASLAPLVQAAANAPRKTMSALSHGNTQFDVRDIGYKCTCNNKKKEKKSAQRREEEDDEEPGGGRLPQRRSRTPAISWTPGSCASCGSI